VPAKAVIEAWLSMAIAAVVAVATVMSALMTEVVTAVASSRCKVRLVRGLRCQCGSLVTNLVDLVEWGLATVGVLLLRGVVFWENFLLLLLLAVPLPPPLTLHLLLCLLLPELLLVASLVNLLHLLRLLSAFPGWHGHATRILWGVALIAGSRELSRMMALRTSWGLMRNALVAWRV
jgi:hypothetical protein